MIERHVTFDVLSDHTAAFEQFFIQEYRPAMSRMPGFTKVDLLREQDSPNFYHMVIRFESAKQPQPGGLLQNTRPCHRSSKRSMRAAS